LKLLKLEIERMKFYEFGKENDADNLERELGVID